MIIKTKNNSLEISTWLIFVGLLVADSIYTNHCRKKVVEKYLAKSDEKEEES